MKEKKKNPPEKKKDRFEITELFMAKAGKKDWTRCFWGTINRDKDENGNEISVSGKVLMKDRAEIWSQAENQDTLGENLDGIVEMVLDYGLHDNAGVTSKICRTPFFHN